jgi:hypothetical protein
VKSTTWYHLVLKNKHNGTVLVFATTRARAKAEEIADSLKDRYSEKAWEYSIEEEATQ